MMNNNYEEEDDEGCVYCENQSVQLISPSGKTLENFLVKIYLVQKSELESDIKIVLSNAKDESISYTSVITHSSFEKMQAVQELHVTYDQLTEELKSLFLNSKMQQVTAKLSETNSGIELGFYTMTSVKEIKLLCVAFVRTPLDTLVQYFKQKAHVYKSRCTSLDQQLKNCQLSEESTVNYYKKEIDDLHKYYKNENKYIKSTFELYKSDVTNKLKTATLEAEQLRNKISMLNDECEKLSREVMRRDALISELQSDNNQLSNALKHITIKNEKQMVSLEKYDKMKRLFSATMADLLKYQIYLKRIKDTSQLQREENDKLREDIKLCIDYITSSCQDDDALAKVVSDNKNVLETIGLLDNRIAQLQLES